jgi:hypothetical protein
MNLKKVLILPVGFILVHILYIGCCKCIEGNFYREPSSMNALHYSKLNNTSLDTVYIKDTLFTSLLVRFNYISKGKSNPFNQLVNAAYATSCNCNTGDLGYKYNIDSLEITSNKNFNGVSAGMNIVDFFKGLYLYTASGAPQYLPVRQMLDSLNKNRRFDNLELITSTLPGPEKNHVLKYRVYSNTKQYAATARKVAVWQ